MLADQFRKAAGSALRQEVPAIRQVLYKASQARQVTWEEVEEIETLLDLRASIPETETPPPRRSTKGKTLETRPMRCARMPRRSVPYRFVRSHGIMPVLDVFLSSGQVRTLQYLICRTGRGHSFTTLTSWLAADLGWHVRTIQVHLRALRLQGYILTSAPNPKTHKITITLTARCEVAPPHVRKKTGPQSQNLKGGATNRSSSTDDTQSKKPRPGTTEALNHEEKGSSHPPQASAPNANRNPAPEQRQHGVFGKAEGASRATAGPIARRPDIAPAASRGGQEGARRPQTPDSAQAPSVASVEPREKDRHPPDAPEPDPERDARRAAAADWAMARIRGRV